MPGLTPFLMQFLERMCLDSEAALSGRHMQLAVYSNPFLLPTVQASRVRKITGRVEEPSV